MSGDNKNDSRAVESRPKGWRIHWQGGNPFRGLRFSLASLMLIVTAAAFGSCCIGMVVRETRGTSLSVAEANKKLWLVHSHCRVPDGATNIDLRASYNGTTMSFEMPFSEFAAYCSDRGWYLRQIDPNWPAMTHNIDYMPMTITDGYYLQ